MRHLVFYDGKCGLCDRAVQFLLRNDHRKIFCFAPLGGEAAKKWISEAHGEDTLILVENFQGVNPRVSILSRAVFRILWLLGGWWCLIGWLGWLPSVLFDWGYRLLARHRHRLFPPIECVRATDSDRFLK